MRPDLLLLLLSLVLVDCCRLTGFSGVPVFDFSAMKLEQATKSVMFSLLVDYIQGGPSGSGTPVTSN